MRLKLALLPLALLASAPAFAQMSPALDRINVSVGAFYGNTDTDITGRTRNLPQNVSGKLNLEHDLGFDDRQTIYRFRADGVIGEHQGWSVDYYDLDRSHGRSYATTVNVGGTPVTGEARVRGKMDLQLASAAYRYWFGHGNDVFGVGLGAAYYHVKLAVSGSATATDGITTVSGSDSENYREGAWAPELTLGYRHAFNDQWRLYVNAAGIKKNGGNLDGHIYNGSLGVEYYPWKNVGFGAEYAVSRVMLHRRGDASIAKLDLRTDGPGVYVHWRF